MFHFNYQDAPKGVKATRGDFVRIARYLLPEWKTSTLILVCILVTALLGLVPPILVRELVDHALPAGDRTRLHWLVAGMIGAPLVGGLIGAWQNRLVAEMSQGVMFDLRDQMYGRLLQQSLRFFTQTKSGEILSRLQNDVGGVQGVVSGTLVALASNGLVLVSTLFVIFRIDWRLALVAVAVLPVFVLPTRKVGQLRSRLSGKTQERMGELTAHLQETLSVQGFLLTRLFGAQSFERGRFREKSAEVRELQIKQALAGRWFLMWLLMFGSVGPALIYLFGGHGVIAGRITLGTMIAFVTYLARLYAPASALVNAHVDVMSAVALFRRIFDYLDLPIELAEPARPTALPQPRGELRFDGVSMGYEEGRLTVEGIDFTAQPGQMVALVGPSGAGKTTLTYLAARLYDPARGRITIDGIDLRDLAFADLARVVAKVTQETTLFHATVAENLRYAKPAASDDELRAACRLAQLEEVVARLPQGLATVVGERGYKLSGGEKQRLALARVVLRDPKVLILDEATSALDSRNEALIQAALEPLLQGRTSLVIAHRLSTILRADQILVLEGGRIVERGVHRELLARGGLYAKLCAEQFGAAATGGAPA